jgi:CheY-like chemotaxis protein
VVVDDDPLVCAHLRTILHTTDDIQVLDIAHDGAAGVEAVVRHRPDLVLMDLRMPGVDGLAATTRIAALPKPPAIVALTTFDADRHVLAALRAGAAGYVVKSTPPRDLIGLVRVAAAGHAVLPPGTTRGPWWLLARGLGRAVQRRGDGPRDGQATSGDTLFGRRTWLELITAWGRSTDGNPPTTPAVEQGSPAARGGEWRFRPPSFVISVKAPGGAILRTEGEDHASCAVDPLP